MNQDKKMSIKERFSEKTAPFFKKVGALSRVQRFLVCLVTIGIIGGSWWYFVCMPKHEELSKLRKDYSQQKTKLATYKRKAARLAEWEKKMSFVQAKFNKAMRALPEKKEIPSLLTAISRSGSNAGLEFLLFQPQAEKVKEYYAIIPVSIKVQGGYHQLAHFFDSVSKLYRTVNTEDINITPQKGSDQLVTSCTAVTYMFLEKVQKDSNNKKRRRKRKK
ncbi:MAG: type 4a pilus biogenesis protein PilO [Thermodesulfobacteriota bacterium]|nr:type 4a pilus biogenesis protein PilO [Thermodesulfobacteriota bacterium]